MRKLSLFLVLVPLLLQACNLSVAAETPASVTPVETLTPIAWPTQTPFQPATFVTLEEVDDVTITTTYWVADNAYSVSVSVTDMKSLLPVEGFALVINQSNKVYTDSTGNWTGEGYENNPPGVEYVKFFCQQNYTDGSSPVLTCNRTH